MGHRVLNFISSGTLLLLYSDYTSNFNLCIKPSLTISAGMTISSSGPTGTNPRYTLALNYAMTCDMHPPRGYLCSCSSGTYTHTQNHTFTCACSFFNFSPIFVSPPRLETPSTLRSGNLIYFLEDDLETKPLFYN